MILVLVLLLIITFFTELIYRQVILNIQWEKELKMFDINKNVIMNLNLKNHKLGSGHIYE